MTIHTLGWAGRIAVHSLDKNHIKSKRYEAAMFDLDGTLLNTLADIATAANTVLARRGLPVHLEDAYRYFVGDGIACLIERMLPEARRDPATVTALLADYRDEYSRTWRKRTRCFPGIPELLDAIAARGLKLAVLSNKPDDLTRRCVAEFLAKWSFDAVAGEREGVPRKPDPAAAVALAESLGVEPARVLYAGDTAVDMQTAAKAGMFAVGVTWGFRPREELEQSGAAVVVDTPREIVALL